VRWVCAVFDCALPMGNRAAQPVDVSESESDAESEVVADVVPKHVKVIDTSGRSQEFKGSTVQAKKKVFEASAFVAVPGSLAARALAGAPKKGLPAPEKLKPWKVVKEADPFEGLVPKGNFGAVWVALEHGIVRVDRDVKSARVGGFQEGERCVQTGVWRADPSGRVRMPIKDPRGITGWVTIDATKCENVDGSFGTQAFELVDSVKDEALKEEGSHKKETAIEAEDEEDDLADLMFGAKKGSVKVASKNPAVVPSVPAPAKPVVQKSKVASHKPTVPPTTPEVTHDNIGDGDDEQETAADIDTPEIAAKEVEREQAGNSSSIKKEKAEELTEAQKCLRALRKKLREIEDLEQKLGGSEPSKEQRGKLARGPELREQVIKAEAEVAAEARDASCGGARKRPSKSGKKKGADKKGGRASSSSGGCCHTLAYMALLPMFGGAAYCYVNFL